MKERTAAFIDDLCSMQGVLLDMELQGLTHTDTYLELKRIWFEVTGKEWN